AQIDALIAESDLPQGTAELARRIFARLAKAEAEVHRVPLESVSFHEVGSVDAIVDIVGAAACFEYLGARVLATPLPMGRGFVRCQHGRLPLPAPATLLCLSGVPTYDAGIEGELVTPTGAAIVATVAEAFLSWPRFVPERTGFGCGTRKLPDRPNALRAVLGAPFAVAASEAASHVVLEANIDDMTGELAAHAISVLLSEGALDAWAQPITMKKGRPGLTLSVLAASDRADALAAAMLRETSSIGVRRTQVSRDERPRRVIEIETRYGRVPVKVSEGDYGPPQRKPEFDVCANLARAAGVPVREVIAAALAALEKKS
ncbi:MAG TPA: nickel pincer cofactor biosynthesis protein LarC, partial [Polyangiaceae bacterium]|nr:nickel pincer cofactor biosynthesis protein LarC [Polyangiaceae bacterium]